MQIGFPIGGGAGGGTECCRIFHNANIVVPSGIWTAVPANSERFDTDNMHDNAVNNSRITFNTAGKYLVWHNGWWNVNVAAGSRLAFIRLNGVTLIGGWSDGVHIAGNAVTHACLTIWDFSVGDYIEAVVLQNSGVNDLYVSAASYAPETAAHRLS